MFFVCPRPYWSVVERCDLLYFCQHPHYGEGCDSPQRLSHLCSSEASSSSTWASESVLSSGESGARGQFPWNPLQRLGRNTQASPTLVLGVNRVRLEEDWCRRWRTSISTLTAYKLM